MRLKGRSIKQTKRNPPKYPLEQQSVYIADRPNYDLPRTINVTESWYKKINSSFS